MHFDFNGKTLPIQNWLLVNILNKFSFHFVDVDVDVDG